MALLTLNSIIKIPVSATFNNVSPAIPPVVVSFGISDTYVSTITFPVSPLTQNGLIAYIGSTLQFTYGISGTYSSSLEVIGSNNVYTVEFLIDDTQLLPTFVGFRDDNGNQYSFPFYVVPDCPPAETTVCPTCYEINKSACEDSYTFEAGLTPSTVYYVVIENNRNKRYVQQVTTDGSGDFTIDATAPEFPVGFFIPEQFKYTLKVYSNSTLMNQEDITIGTTIYQCITLGFVNTVTTTASANFGVDFLIDDELNFIVDDLGNTFSAND